MRAVKISLISLISLSILCSCAIGNNGVDLKISSPDKTVFELVTKSYDDSQLSEIWEFANTLSALDNKYPVECLRESNGDYRASYLGDNSILVLFFDDSGERTGGFVYDISPPRAEFDSVSIGQSVFDVKDLDPDGSYLFLYSGSDEFPHESMHFTEDGYMITITYDDSDTVTDIKEELI